ncbi:YciI family protein [Nocardia australiensis]|uniref:YciI family protein n=1 Tax=Nocardia australiensis TaxID=2887191 RepID=UPI001D158698|nr:YciI family protein [Nocardia australiensis]
MKFVPHRLDFPANLTDAESAVMTDHFAYWRRNADAGVAIVYGPVGDPTGVWGLAVVEVATEADAQVLRADDPVIRGDLGQFHIYPMLDAVVR